MNDYNDVMCQVRESFSGMRMEVPVEAVFARSRARRHRRLAGLTTAVAATAGAATAITLTLGGPSPAQGGPASARSSVPAPASEHSATLAAFSVSDGPGGSTTLVLHKGPKYAQFDPAALRRALAKHGIPALVTVGTFCRSAGSNTADLGQVVRPSDEANGSAMVINGQAMPAGTRLSIGYFRQAVRMALVSDSGPLSCGTDSSQPAARNASSGDAIRLPR